MMILRFDDKQKEEEEEMDVGWKRKRKTQSTHRIRLEGSNIGSIIRQQTSTLTSYRTE